MEEQFFPGDAKPRDACSLCTNYVANKLANVFLGQMLHG